MAELGRMPSIDMPNSIAGSSIRVNRDIHWGLFGSTGTVTAVPSRCGWA